MTPPEARAESVMVCCDMCGAEKLAKLPVEMCVSTGELDSWGVERLLADVVVGTGATEELGDELVG